jgi:hypothetical protein
MSRGGRARLAPHVPRLAALALAMVAAAASYAVHADRSASAQDERPADVARPAAGAGHHRPASHAHRKRGKHRHARRFARLARERPVRTTVVVNRVVRAPCTRPRIQRPREPPPNDGIRHGAETEADRNAERDVDRALQRVIDQDVAGSPAAAPTAPPAPAPPGA